jgi:hypothetical protein
MGWQDDALADAPWEADELADQPKAPKPGADAKSRAMAGAGGLVTGASYLAGLPMDTARNIANLGLTGYGAIKNLLTGDNKSPKVLDEFPGGGASIAGAAKSAGLPVDNPNPDDPASRMLHMGGTIAGGSLMPGAGVKASLAAATGGALASEIDPGNPLYAAAGAMAPGAAASGANAVRQASTAKTRANLNMFKDAGVKPSVGMVTDNWFFHGIENLLAKFPGGTGVLNKFRKDIQESLGARTRTDVSAEDAGRAIERGVAGKGGFLEKTAASWKALDAKMGAKVAKNTTIMPMETSRILDELTAPIQGAENVTSGLVNPKLKQMRDNLEADLTNGRIPFEAIRKLRTQVGSMVEDSLVSGVPGSQVKALYKALSSDLEDAAKAGGAGQEFARQNAYWQARMGRIERVLDRVIGKNKNPEDIFKSFYTPEGVNKIRGVMRSLPNDERKVVSRAVVDSLGKASPGKQNEAGELFSSETFLTNWTKLHTGAKSVLFPDKAMRENLDAVAKASDNIRHSNAFVNPSGTAGSFAGYSVYLAPLTLNPAVIGTAAGAVTTAYGASKLLTMPRFVNWLAHGPTKDPKAIAAHFARLSVIYNEADDAEKEALGQYIQNANGEQ